MEIRHRLGLLVLLVARTSRAVTLLHRLLRLVILLRVVTSLGLLRLAGGRGRPRSRLLSLETHVLLLKSTGYLGSLPKEIEILPNLAAATSIVVAATAKGIVIERVVSVVELIAEAVVGVFEFKSVVHLSVTRQASEGVVSLGEPRLGLVMAAGVEAEERHGCLPGSTRINCAVISLSNLKDKPNLVVSKSNGQSEAEA